MTFQFIITYLTGVVMQAVVNIFVDAPAIIVALFFYEKFIRRKNSQTELDK